MFSVNLNKVQVNEAELKAYIYQQLNDIQPYVGESPVSIKMSYNDDRFEVKISAAHEIGEIEVEGHHEDVYKALADAKRALIKSLIKYDIDDEDESPAERDQAIHDIIARKNQVH